MSPVDALALLIDFLLIASSPQGVARSVSADADDGDGSDTVNVLTKAKDIARRIVGNDPASLGLHPAVYFYNERGAYSRHLFLGMVRLITEKVRNNDHEFFRKFTDARARMEEFLVANKSLITQAFTNINRDARIVRVHDLLSQLVDKFSKDTEFSIEQLFAAIGLTGRILEVQGTSATSTISKETKSAVYLRTSLATAPRCPICRGYLYPKKSVTYDHIIRVREGGGGTVDNTQMVHPYCNSAVKN